MGWWAIVLAVVAGAVGALLGWIDNRRADRRAKWIAVQIIDPGTVPASTTEKENQDDGRFPRVRGRNR